jgi:hypothetical protein
MGLKHFLKENILIHSLVNNKERRERTMRPHPPIKALSDPPTEDEISERVFALCWRYDEDDYRKIIPAFLIEQMLAYIEQNDPEVLPIVQRKHPEDQAFDAANWRYGQLTEQVMCDLGYTSETSIAGIGVSRVLSIVYEIEELPALLTLYGFDLSCMQDIRTRRGLPDYQDILARHQHGDALLTLAGREDLWHGEEYTFYIFWAPQHLLEKYDALKWHSSPGM